MERNPEKYQKKYMITKDLVKEMCETSFDTYRQKWRAQHDEVFAARQAIKSQNNKTRNRDGLVRTRF